MSIAPLEPADVTRTELRTNHTKLTARLYTVSLSVVLEERTWVVSCVAPCDGCYQQTLCKVGCHLVETLKCLFKIKKDKLLTLVIYYQSLLSLSK